MPLFNPPAPKFPPLRARRRGAAFLAELIAAKDCAAARGHKRARGRQADRFYDVAGYLATVNARGRP